MKHLTVSRRQELEEIIGDAIIGGRAHLRRIGEAFAEIQDKRLFAPEYDSFEAYAMAVWNFTPERARVIASGWKMADQAAKQTRAEDMPLYFHSWFTNVVEDVGRALENLSPGERDAAIIVARRIGTAKVGILDDLIEKHGATPEALANLSADEQTQRLREVNDDATRQFGEEDAAEWIESARRRVKKSVEELNKDPAIATYLRPGVEAAVRAALAACSPSD